MQALAQYIMRRRFNAVFVAFVFALLPLLEWLSAATVALVTLRKGWQQGLFILTWACLAAGARWAVGDALTLPMLAMVFAGALVLRQTVSLLYAVISITALSAVMMLLFDKIMPAGLAVLIETAGQLLSKQQLLETLAISNSEQWLKEFAITVFGFSAAASALAALLIARWWQAVLYNPGGFQEEFHRLRLPPLILAALVAVAVLMAGLVPELRFIAVLVNLPVILAGVALVHSVVKFYGLGSQALVPFYILLFVFSAYVYLLLLLLVIADSVIDIRKRLASTKHQ